MAVADFFFSSRRRHTRFDCDWSSDVCSSDLGHRLRFVSNTTTTSRAVLADELRAMGIELEDDELQKIGRASCRERVQRPVVALYSQKPIAGGYCALEKPL